MTEGRTDPWAPVTLNHARRTRRMALYRTNTYPYRYMLAVRNPHIQNEVEYFYLGHMYIDQPQRFHFHFVRIRSPPGTDSAPNQ